MIFLTSFNKIKFKNYLIFDVSETLWEVGGTLAFLQTLLVILEKIIFEVFVTV